jgi:lipopolysaccharide/colanic/teichoic acid biosynthesis glycosyltransferase
MFNQTQTPKQQHIMCICDRCDIQQLSQMLPHAIISTIGFQETGQILFLKPDAVIVMISEFPVSVLNQVRNLRHFMSSTHIPLLVMGKNFSFEDKRVLVTNGADDCIDSNSVHEGFDKWIEFLKLSKKVAANKVQTQKEFKVPVGKRLFDIVASFIALLLLSPIMLLIAIVIKLESKGPVIYSSKRAGSGYKVFDFLKFRSMYVGADAELAKMKHLNQYGNGVGGGTSVFFKLENDPRVTRFGHFLRNTSLDELPQLINVLKGDMSIVGNRPLPLYEAQMLTKDHAAMRFMAPAGITGLWQVTKRGKKELSEEERIALDVEYANNHSLKNDINIVIKTFPALAQEVSM